MNAMEVEESGETFVATTETASDILCDMLADWKGNLSSFPAQVNDWNEFVEGCILSDVSKEYIEEPTYQWAALALILVPLAGVLGNSLVCIAVWQERRLHNVTNFFLVSLALADLMVCLAVMPFGVVELFYGKSLLALSSTSGNFFVFQSSKLLYLFLRDFFKTSFCPQIFSLISQALPHYCEGYT